VTEYNIQSSDSFLEQKKNRLLCSLYEQDHKTAKQISSDIISHVKTIGPETENSEKLLNQIHSIIKKFTPDKPQYKPFQAQLNEYSRLLKIHLLSSLKKSSQNISYIDFKTWELKLGLTSEQKNLIYKTAMTFQLTVGCSNFCRRCNEWALPKIRSHFTFDAIKKILSFMAGQKNSDISLFGASDPLDWQEQSTSKEKTEKKDMKRNIYDIIAYLNKIRLTYNILTKVPKGRASLLKKLIKANTNLSVSITSKNKDRIYSIEKTIKGNISKQHDLDELLIPAGLDEDFLSVKPSITDGYGSEITPDGAFIIIPTFTSALHPFGHKKIPVTCETQFFPIKKTGRDALLVDYFKPLKGYNLHSQTCCLDFLLDIQIESIILDNGREELTPPGMRSFKEFLSIFDEKPRLQRKKMTKTVLRHLKKQFLAKINFKDLDDQTRTEYQKKIQSHLDLCNKRKCIEIRILAVSFVLEAVSRYAANNRVKVKIMQFLLRDEIKTAELNHFNKKEERLPEAFLKDSDIDSFEIFRIYLFTLLDNPGSLTINRFVKRYPSQYDASADIFIPDKSVRHDN